MDFNKLNNSVRLSTLNSAVRERVEKFDTANDGELDINEAMQGLITLQKQSNNYKKMIWLLIPVLCLVLAGSFGTTILAINLTKEIHSNNGLLASSSNNTPLRTVQAVAKDLMYSSIFSEDYNQVTKLHFGSTTLNVNQIYQAKLTDTNTVYVNSDMIHFGLNQTGRFWLNYNQGFENNVIAKVVYQNVYNALSEYMMILDYYQSVRGVQPTFDEIAKYTSLHTVTTTKVPKDYSISTNTDLLSSTLVTSTSRMAALEADAGSSLCHDGGVYEHSCYTRGNACWECTITVDPADRCCGLPSSFRTCVSHIAIGSNCKRAN